MIRFQIPVLAMLFAAACSCATPSSRPAGARPMSVFAQLLSSEPRDASGCDPWLKLEGPIRESETFVAALQSCGDRDVVVEINSPGGSIFAALEMQKAIERHPGTVTCVVDGMAASAAFVTLQSCDVRLMTDRSVLMAHHASIPETGGQEEQLQNMADALREIDRGMSLHCARRMGLTPDEFESHVSGGREWWLGLEAGLANRAVDREVRDVRDALGPTS